jgi:hypothetical protein
MTKWTYCGLLVASLLVAQFASPGTAYSMPGDAAAADISGTYSPISIDSGVTLSIAVNQSFSADWWAQDMKSGAILRGTLTGNWKKDVGRVVLYFKTKDRKDCVCEFRSGTERGKLALILVRPSIFPLSLFFGTIYFRVESKAEAVPLPRRSEGAPQ